MNINKFEPVYDVMKEQGIIEQRIFSMCLGKDGGYFQIGGYDMTGHLPDKSSNNNRDLTWIDLLYAQSDFKVALNGIAMNNYPMQGTTSQYETFIDSGTTFTYVSSENYYAIKKHFEWFCSIDPTNHCKG